MPADAVRAAARPYVAAYVHRLAAELRHLPLDDQRVPQAAAAVACRVIGRLAPRFADPELNDWLDELASEVMREIGPVQS